MARRFEIKETADKDGIREFSVGYPEQPQYERVGVWVGSGSVPRCSKCSTLTVAMLASCKHALAVKRYLKREAQKEE